MIEIVNDDQCDHERHYLWVVLGLILMKTMAVWYHLLLIELFPQAGYNKAEHALTHALDRIEEILSNKVSGLVELDPLSHSCSAFSLVTE